MKRTYKLFLVFLLVSVFGINFLAIASVRTVVSGKIVDPKSQSAAVSIYKNFVTYEQRVDRSQLNDNGEFKLEFSLTTPVAASFIYGSEEVKIYLSPGDSIFILLDSKKPVETLRIAGKGALENNIMATMHRLDLAPEYNDSIKLETITSEDDFLAYADNKRKQQLDQFFRSTARHQPSKPFREYIIARINYSWANLLFKFASKQDSLSPDYFNFINTIKVNNDKAMGSQAYINFLDSYVNKIIAPKDINPQMSKAENDALYLQKYYSYKSAFTGEVQSYVLAKLLTESFQKGNPELMEDSYKNFKAINKYPAYDKIVTRAFETAKNLSSKKSAPVFTVTDSKGQEITLQDLRGKVVVLNFWAEWCLPCRENMALYNIINNNLGGKVVFINISLDQQEASWRNNLEQSNLPGTHILLKNGLNSELAKSYAVNSIPQYWVIDVNGNISSGGYIHNISTLSQEITKALQ